jgi:hypothetical protein
MKDGKPLRKTLEIQVYNRGGSKPFELNHYIGESVELDEVSKKTAKGHLDRPDQEDKDYDSPRKFRNRMTGGAIALRKLGKKIPGRRSQPNVSVRATDESIEEKRETLTMKKFRETLQKITKEED